MNIFSNQERPTRARSQGPWTPFEIDALKMIAQQIPNLYQNPCKQGNSAKFNDIRMLLAKQGIKKTTEQVNRAWKERACPNIIPEGVHKQDHEILERLYFKYQNSWSLIAEEYCRDYGYREGRGQSPLPEGRGLRVK